MPTPTEAEEKLRAARSLYDMGDAARAVALAKQAVAELTGGQASLRSEALSVLGASYCALHDARGAIAVYAQIPVTIFDGSGQPENPFRNWIRERCAEGDVPIGP